MLNALAVEIDDRRVEPVGRCRADFGVSINKIGLVFILTSNVTLVVALGVADDDFDGLLQSEQANRDAACGLRSDRLDAQTVVERRIAYSALPKKPIIGRSGNFALIIPIS